MNVHSQVEAGTDIAAVVAANPVSVLVDDKVYSQFYQHIKAETEAFKPDLSTVSSRKEISSLAYKVTRTKTAIDAAGKKLNEDARAQINAVDAQRRKIREELDALAESVRKPLTEWEAAETARVDRVKAMLLHIEECGKGLIDGEPQPFAILFHELEEKIVIDDAFGEFADQARTAKRIAHDKLTAAFQEHQRAEADRIELEKLRAEAAERERIDAERQEAERQAAENAQRSKAEAERAEREAAEQKAREERAAQIAREEEQRKAKEAVARAEREKAEAIAKAEAEARAVKEKAEREERERQESIERTNREEAARQADREHRAKVMGETKAALIDAGASEDLAKKIVLAIVANEIPYVTLRF